MKIKPLRKKHRFLRWLKKLLGIQSPSGMRELGDIDEMHKFLATAPVLTKEQKALYTNTMNRLRMIGKMDTPSQIAYLAEEIEFYRGKIGAMKERMKERDDVVRLLKQDIADRDKMLEAKVEEVYADFMRDYRQMREELEELTAELAEDKAKNKQLKEERDNAN